MQIEGVRVVDIPSPAGEPVRKTTKVCPRRVCFLVSLEYEYFKGSNFN